MKTVIRSHSTTSLMAAFNELTRMSDLWPAECIDKNGMTMKRKTKPR